MHDRDRPDPAHRLVQRGPGVRDSIRRACSRSSAATVCRLFFTRWWISRIVVSLVTSSRSRRRRSVTSRTRISAPMCSPAGRSGMARTIRATDSVPSSVSWLTRPPSTALSVSSSGRWRCGTSSRVRSVSTQPGQVAGEPEPAVDRQRVRARVDDPALGVDPQEPVADPRGVGVVAALPRHREVAVGDHLGEVARGLQVGQLQPARRPDAEQVGVAADDRDHPAGAADRDRLGAHRHVVAPLGVALADQPALGVRQVDQRPAPGRHEACPRCRRRTPSGRSSGASGRRPRTRCRRGRAATAPGRRSSGRR